jgi:hypothetical protein
MLYEKGTVDEVGTLPSSVSSRPHIVLYCRAGWPLQSLSADAKEEEARTAARAVAAIGKNFMVGVGVGSDSRV